MEKSDSQKIREWAESLKQTDPQKWEAFVNREIDWSNFKISRKEAEERIIKTRIASCQINKVGIPRRIRWNGSPSQHDQDCQRCKVLGNPGRLRYLGEHRCGTETACKVWVDDDGIEQSGDVSFPNYLDCWRCDFCGNEETDGY